MLACVAASAASAEQLAAECRGRVYRLGCAGVRVADAERNVVGGWVVWITGWLPEGRVTSGEGTLVTLPRMRE